MPQLILITVFAEAECFKRMLNIKEDIKFGCSSPDLGNSVVHITKHLK